MANRPNLRKLALAAGIVEKSAKIFQLDAKELNKLLEDEFPDIAEMDDDDVVALINGLDEKPAAKKPAAKKPAGRRRKKAAEEEPSEGEAPAPKRRRRTTKKAAETEEEEPAKKPAAKRRTRRGSASKKATEETAVPATGTVDLGELPDKVDTIGGLVDDLSKKVKNLATSKELEELGSRLSALSDKLDGIDAALVVLYNEGVEEEADELGSTLELIEEG